MRKLLHGTLVVGVNALLIGLLAWDGAGIHPVWLVVIAAAFNLVVGIRLGYNAAEAYIRDVIRLNRFLADQNESLVMSNRELLERLTSGLPTPRTRQRFPGGASARGRIDRRATRTVPLTRCPPSAQRTRFQFCGAASSAAFLVGRADECI